MKPSTELKERLHEDSFKLFRLSDVPIAEIEEVDDYLYSCLDDLFEFHLKQIFETKFFNDQQMDGPKVEINEDDIYILIHCVEEDSAIAISVSPLRIEAHYFQYCDTGPDGGYEVAQEVEITDALLDQIDSYEYALRLLTHGLLSIKARKQNA